MKGLTEGQLHYLLSELDARKRRCEKRANDLSHAKGVRAEECGKADAYEQVITLLHIFGAENYEKNFLPDEDEESDEMG
jgi:hypothetical protein|nr:MAG TPA: hypothetical protein [Caudoviricetes sp.]